MVYKIFQKTKVIFLPILFLLLFMVNGIVFADDNQITNISYLDTDSNGFIDRIQVKVDNSTSHSTAAIHDFTGWAVTKNGNPVDIVDVSFDGNSNANPLVINVDLDELDGDLGYGTYMDDLEITYTQQGLDAGTEYNDSLNTQLVEIVMGDTDNTNTEQDAAPPVCDDARAEENTKVVVVCSEEIASIANADGSDFSATGLTLSSAVIDILPTQINLTVAPLNDTSYTAIDFAVNADAVSDNAGNLSNSISGKEIHDFQKPYIKDVEIEDADFDGLIDKITYIWSEEVDTDDSIAPIASDLPDTILPDGSLADFSNAVISDPAGISDTVVVTGVTGQGVVNTTVGVTSVSGDLSAKWVDTAIVPNSPDASGATANENIIDRAAPALLSFTSTTLDGTYGSGSDINITANYSEAVDIGSQIQVDLDAVNNINLITISGNSISTIYTVGATGSGQDTIDLRVDSIQAGGHSVSDSFGNTNNTLTLPVNNINDTSDIVIDVTAPIQPLLENITNDSGISNIDQITNDNTLHFTGLSESGLTVKLFIDNVDTGVTTVADVNDNFDIDYTSHSFADGEYQAKVVATDLSGNESVLSESLSFIIDTQEPSVSGNIDVHVDENTTEVAVDIPNTITITDADPVLTYSIDNTSKDHASFTINSSTGELSFANRPDYENPGNVDGDNVYEVTVNVEDEAGNGQGIDVQITLDNIDETPVIPNSNIGSRDEDLAVGTVLYNVNDFYTHNDNDGDGDPITYAITGGNNGNVFAIDPATGVVTLAASLDYETTNSYHLTYSGTSTTGANPALTGNGGFWMTVNDIPEATGKSGKITFSSLSGKSAKKACKDTRATNFSNIGQHEPSLCIFPQKQTSDTQAEKKGDDRLAKRKGDEMLANIEENNKLGKRLGDDMLAKRKGDEMLAKCLVFTKNLRIGNRGEEVKKVQSFLKEQGFFTFPKITGYFGRITKKAVSDFQAKYADEILKPIGLTKPTGNWYGKTRAKANSFSKCSE